MKFVGNAFSLQMLNNSGKHVVVTQPVNIDQAKQFASSATSCVGHKNTADVFSEQLGVEILPNRVSISMTDGDQLLVGQLSDVRLPEGATSLPDGFSISWIIVSLIPQADVDGIVQLAIQSHVGGPRGTVEEALDMLCSY